MITQKRIFFVWLPLAAMWLIMGIEQPAITSLIARLGDAKIQLAAFGIAFAFVLIMESPILQLLTAATALSTDTGSFRRLFIFTTLLGGGMTLIHVVFGVSPLFRLLLVHLVKIPEEVVIPARTAYLIMSPGVMLVAYRRLCQGVLIRYQHTTVVAVAMLVRIVAVALVLFFGVVYKVLPGATIGAIAMNAGILLSALAAYLPARKVLRSEVPKSKGDLEWRRLLSFYIPLALTSFISLAARPLLTMGLALAPQPLESLAVWPVLTGFLFLFTSIDISYQEVVVTLYRADDDFLALKKFSLRLAAISTGVFLIAALLPVGPSRATLSSLWFRDVAGLSPELLEFTPIPIIVIAVIPGIVSLVSWFRGILIARKQTAVITKAIIANLLCMVGVIFAGALLLPLPGVVVAAGAYVCALLAEMLFLRGKIFPNRRRVEKSSHTTVGEKQLKF